MPCSKRKKTNVGLKISTDSQDMDLNICDYYWNTEWIDISRVTKCEIHYEIFDLFRKSIQTLKILQVFKYLKDGCI